MIGGGPIGLSFMQVAALSGCHVIAVVKHDQQVEAARKFGAAQHIQIAQDVQIPQDVLSNVSTDAVAAVKALTPHGRGADVVIEAVGRPLAWEWAVDMVRRGGVVNFFGGCATGTKVSLDTNRLHYSEITLKASFHHTPLAVRHAFDLIARQLVNSADYITGEAPLSHLQQVLQQMSNRGSAIKTAIIPG